ncbi:MAG: hypothetical protein MHM6MM_000223 [Cercozoa sp. M6MM]
MPTIVGRFLRFAGRFDASNLAHLRYFVYLSVAHGWMALEELQISYNLAPHFLSVAQQQRMKTLMYVCVLVAALLQMLALVAIVAVLWSNSLSLAAGRLGTMLSLLSCAWWMFKVAGERNRVIPSDLCGETAINNALFVAMLAISAYYVQKSDFVCCIKGSEQLQLAPPALRAAWGGISQKELFERDAADIRGQQKSFTEKSFDSDDDEDDAGTATSTCGQNMRRLDAQQLYEQKEDEEEDEPENYGVEMTEFASPSKDKTD